MGEEQPAALAVINSPQGCLEPLLARLAPVNGRGLFVLSVGGTATSDREGISAAGRTSNDRRLTPCLDAEALMAGVTLSASALPVSPAGIVSPVVLTRAALSFLAIDIEIVDCGSFVPPAVRHLALGRRHSRCLSTGAAQSLEQVEDLFHAGMRYGGIWASAADYIMLAECVPGGTTTAAAVLAALGYDCSRYVSSSLPVADRFARQELIARGLACHNKESLKANPLAVLAAVGDPVQPFISGVALAASGRAIVILAGGSQMLAIWALTISAASALGIRFSRENAAVITTSWVAEDPDASFKRLAEIVQAPALAIKLDLSCARHGGLRAYEIGHVKEGVGAGAALAAAHLIGRASDSQLLEAIEASYVELTLRCYQSEMVL